MFSKAIQSIQHSIFPIFSTNVKQTLVLGTGFFIDKAGHFITAAHVVNALQSDAKLGYLGNIPHSKFVGKKFIGIKILRVDTQKDLALGKIDQDILPPLAFAASEPKVGDSITLCGYPLPMIVKGQPGDNKNTLDVTAVRQYWQPTIMMDSIRKNFLYKKSFKSFITQHAALPGMSGGPIFNPSGQVVGVLSANWTRQISRPNKVNINVENGIGISLSEITSFLQQ